MHSRPWKISAPSRLTPEKLEFTQRCVELGCQSGITLHISKCGRSWCVFLEVFVWLFSCFCAKQQTSSSHPFQQRCSSQVQLLDESLRIKWVPVRKNCLKIGVTLKLQVDIWVKVVLHVNPSNMPYSMSIGFLLCWRPGISFPMPHATATMLPCIVLQYVIFGEGALGIGRQAWKMS